ncbi:MAG: zinc metalloprotease HtpX [Syntrophomonadaceae bacterium]
MNNIKAFALMSGLSILLVLLGSAVGGTNGAAIFFLISLGMNLFSYYYSDKMVIKMTKAQEIEESQAPQIYAMIRKLTSRAGIPMPKIYVTPSMQPNAFATGRNPENSAVAVTQGLLKILDQDELEGVLAHEIAHIKNRDILIGTMAASIAGAIAMIANVAQLGLMFGGFGGSDDDDGGGILGTLVMALLAPIAAMIIQMAISRSREYGADETGANLAGNPQGLSSALLKLQAASQRVPMEISPGVAHMFIVNPLAGFSLASLFSTHPPVEQRVAKLNLIRS